MVSRDTLELKLVDFGSARSSTDPVPYTEYVSTRWYRAPECILTDGAYGKEVDAWATGCILFELLAARPLFPGMQELDQLARIHNILGTPSEDLLSKFRSGATFSFPYRPRQDLRQLLPFVNDSTLALLEGLLAYDPSERLSISAALNHSAFALFRESEQKWKSSESNVPLPLFLLLEAAARLQPPNGLNLVSAKNQAPRHSGRWLMLAKNRPPDRPPQAVRPSKVQNDTGLAESRARALDRIKIYNRKMAEEKQEQNNKNMSGAGELRVNCYRYGK
jgi:renal tumor antigen